MATYIPGVCNIGPEERKRRARAGWTGLIVTALLALSFVWIGAKPLLWTTLFVPAVISALGFLQAALGFCVSFATQGVFNVTHEAGKIEAVSQAEFRAKDRQRALLITALAIVIAAIVAALGYAYGAYAARSQAPSSSSRVTTAIPGDNLALGKDSSATLGSYLIGYDGMPVYTYGKDIDGSSHCDASCLGTSWKPYIVTSANLVAEAPLDSIYIGTTTRADGSVQLTYKNLPLYFYAKDTTDTPEGQGLDYAWYVARP